MSFWSAENLQENEAKEFWLVLILWPPANVLITASAIEWYRSVLTISMVVIKNLVEKFARNVRRFVREKDKCITDGRTNMTDYLDPLC